MNSTIRSLKKIARDFLPPIALRRIKDVRQSLRIRSPLRIPNTGRSLIHRGTNTDTEIFDQMFLARVYDFTQLSRHREIDSYYNACPMPLILDCGANIGASTIWFATQFPRSTVVAVEPEPGNFALLKKNTENANAIAVHGAVAGHAGELQLFDPGLGSAGFRTGASGNDAGPGTVHAYTLDTLAAMVPGSTPFILKIDIEGAEGDLFKTHHSVLDNCPIVIIELHDWMLPRTASSRAFLKWHVSQDRDFVHIGENIYSLCNRLLPCVT